jgi:hypothetical protein
MGEQLGRWHWATFGPVPHRHTTKNAHGWSMTQDESCSHALTLRVNRWRSGSGRPPGYGSGGPFAFIVTTTNAFPSVGSTVAGLTVPEYLIVTITGMKPMVKVRFRPVLFRQFRGFDRFFQSAEIAFKVVRMN